MFEEIENGSPHCAWVDVDKEDRWVSLSESLEIVSQIWIQRLD